MFLQLILRKGVNIVGQLTAYQNTSIIPVVSIINVVKQFLCSLNSMLIIILSSSYKSIRTATAALKCIFIPFKALMFITI